MFQSKIINPKKTFKDSYTNTNYKRPFILEKFAKDLHSPNLINILNNKNKNPLIQKKKELKKIKIPRKLKLIPKKKKMLHFPIIKHPFFV